MDDIDRALSLKLYDVMDQVGVREDQETAPGHGDNRGDYLHYLCSNTRRTYLGLYIWEQV